MLCVRKQTEPPVLLVSCHTFFAIPLILGCSIPPPRSARAVAAGPERRLQWRGAAGRGRGGQRELRAGAAPSGISPAAGTARAPSSVCWEMHPGWVQPGLHLTLSHLYSGHLRQKKTKKPHNFLGQGGRMVFSSHLICQKAHLHPDRAESWAWSILYICVSHFHSTWEQNGALYWESKSGSRDARRCSVFVFAGFFNTGINIEFCQAFSFGFLA